MIYLLSLLASILTGLRETAAQVSPRRRARSPVVTPQWDHLDHMFACLERLYADWRDGNLPQPCEPADLPGAGAARLSRSTLPDTALPDTTLPDTGMTAPRLTPPPSASPHPPLPASCARSGACSASTAASSCRARRAAPAARKNPPGPCAQTHVLIVTI
jgi:hypothetical protein